MAYLAFFGLGVRRTHQEEHTKKNTPPLFSSGSWGKNPQQSLTQRLAPSESGCRGLQPPRHRKFPPLHHPAACVSRVFRVRGACVRAAEQGLDAADSEAVERGCELEHFFH